MMWEMLITYRDNTIATDNSGETELHKAAEREIWAALKN